MSSVELRQYPELDTATEANAGEGLIIWQDNKLKKILLEKVSRQVDIAGMERGDGLEMDLEESEYIVVYQNGKPYKYNALELAIELGVIQHWEPYYDEDSEAWEDAGYEVGDFVFHDDFLWRKAQEGGDNEEPTEPIWGKVLDTSQLQLGTAATKDVGTAPGNVMQVGAFGLGGTPSTYSTVDSLPLGTYFFNGKFASELDPLGTTVQTLRIQSGRSDRFALLQIGTGNPQGGRASSIGYTPFNERGSGGFREIHHTGNILKTTGNNDNFPMSQKAVTDALAGGNATPSGGIILWSGAINTIPAGWALCDGRNGTPDLRNRFIVGAGSSYAVGATGGSGTTSSAGEHAHMISVGAITLSAAQMPSHRHRTGLNLESEHPNSRAAYASEGFASNGSGRRSSPDTSVSSREISLTSNLGRSNSHTHSGSSNNTGAHTHTITPPYYALAFIMKL